MLPRYISKEGNFTSLIDLVIISHFHLDHCGSASPLPAMQVHYFCANKIASSARVLNICPFAAKVAAILHTDARLRWTNLRNTSHESCHAHPPRGSFLPCLAASFVPNLMPRSTTLLGAPQDYRKITVEKRGVDEKDFFTSQNVRECMAKVHSSPLRTMETVQTNTETVRRVMESVHTLCA